MKKAFMSPLCSGLIIPGLGQIINEELKKGIILLGALFLLFVVGTIKLVLLIHAVFKKGPVDLSDPEVIMARLRAEDPFILWIMAAALGAIWLYGVWDAYVGGKKMDQKEAERDRS